MRWMIVYVGDYRRAYVYLNFLQYKMIENIQEQFAETSANGLNTQTSGATKVAPQRVSKKGGARFSFQQRTSQKAFRQKTSKLKNSVPAAFEKANWDLAMANTKKKMNRYYKGKEVDFGVDLEHFKIYGPGIYLFFSFLKSLTIAFLFMSIIQLTPIIYNYFQGKALSDMTVSLNYYLAKTTIAANSPSTSADPSIDKMINVISDMVCIFIFICFYFFWLKRGNTLTEQVRKQVKLKSYTVVEILDPPPKTTEDDVRRFMEQFGKVVEVAAVRDFDESIHLSKKIYDLQVQIKENELKLEEKADPNLEKQIAEAKQNIDEIYKELVLYQDDIKEQTIKYYVTFSTIQQRENAINGLAPYKPTACDCCSDLPPDNFLLGGSKVKVQACHTEPGDIIWENQHVTWKTRWMRALVQFILLLTVIAIGFLVISFLNILAPSSTSSVDTSSYTQTSIKSETNTTILQSWCITNQATVLQGSDTALYNLCWTYIEKYYIKIAITIGIAVAVIIIKAIIKLVVVFLGKFQRYKSHTQQSKDITQNLLLTYLSTTVLITFLLQAQFRNISFKNLISYFINSSYLSDNLSNLSTYSDFILEWYPNIGYQIVFTWIIMIIHPCLTMPFVHYIQECIAEWKAKDEEVHANMEKRLQPMEFQIQDNYANVLMIVFVSLGLSPGMPLVTIVTFFALWLRYLYLKYIFIRYCKVPKTYDEALDLKVAGLLPYAVILHFMFGIWMFGVTTIFNSDSSSFESWVNGLNYTFIQQIGFIIARVFGTWYYSAFFILVLALFFFKLIIFNLIAKNFMKDSNDVNVVQIRSKGSGQDVFNVSTKNFCDSYKIENNPDYTEVLSIMHKKRKFVVRVKEVDGSI